MLISVWKTRQNSSQHGPKYSSNTATMHDGCLQISTRHGWFEGAVQFCPAAAAVWWRHGRLRQLKVFTVRSTPDSPSITSPIRCNSSQSQSAAYWSLHHTTTSVGRKTQEMGCILYLLLVNIFRSKWHRKFLSSFYVVFFFQTYLGISWEKQNNSTFG